MAIGTTNTFTHQSAPGRVKKRWSAARYSPNFPSFPPPSPPSAAPETAAAAPAAAAVRAISRRALPRDGSTRATSVREGVAGEEELLAEG